LHAAHQDSFFGNAEFLLEGESSLMNICTESSMCMFGSGNGDDKFRDANNFWKLGVTDND